MDHLNKPVLNDFSSLNNDQKNEVFTEIFKMLSPDQQDVIALYVRGCINQDSQKLWQKTLAAKLKESKAKGLPIWTEMLDSMQIQELPPFITKTISPETYYEFL